MTSQPSNNGGQGGAEDTKMTAAKALFITFFAAALGWAGVLVAALAVATEQTWSKGRTEGSRARERRSGWFAGQEAWLGQDHRNRQARSQAVRDWMNAGADPTKRPATPSRRSRLADGLHRLVANLALAAVHFTQGLVQGGRAANRARKNGAGFRDTAATRPQPQDDGPAFCRRCDVWPPARGTDLCDSCHALENSPQPSAPTKPVAGRQPVDAPPATPVPAAAPSTEPPAEPTAQEPTATEGEPMPATQAPDSNATVLAAKLTEIKSTVGDVSADVDTLSSISAELRAKVISAADLAASAGMPTEAVVAVDTIQRAASILDARVDDFSTAAAEATTQLTKAADGLNPVVQVEDQLHAAGADGRVFDTAGV